MQELHDREKLAAPERIEQMLHLVDVQRDKEKVLQGRFAGLLADRMELSNTLSKVAQ